MSTRYERTAALSAYCANLHWHPTVTVDVAVLAVKISYTEQGPEIVVLLGLPGEIER